MNLRAELIRGLTSVRPFVPVWYQYDTHGMEYFNDSTELNTFYYLPKYEKMLLEYNVQELMQNIQKPYKIVDLGCGNARKCHHFFDEYLKEENHLEFVPVDICTDVFEEAERCIKTKYGNKITVRPIGGEFYTSVPEVFKHGGKKLLTMFGNLQMFPYEEQIHFLSFMSKKMSEDDLFVLTMDITQDEEQILKAYIDPSGYFDKQSARGIERLNEEHGANFDLDKFVIEGKVIRDEDQTIPSAIHIWFRSLVQQTVNVEGLGVEMNFNRDDKLYIAEYGDSYKYTEDQLDILFQKSNLKIVKMWKNKHVAMVLVRKETDGLKNK